MTAQERLVMLKHDLQLLTSANDEYLTFLLSRARDALIREGVVDDNSADYEGVVISYASFLYSKRNADPSGGKEGQTAMPRFLRYQINNLIVSQKAGDPE